MVPGIQVLMEVESPRVGAPPGEWFFSSESLEERDRNKWNRSPERFHAQAPAMRLPAPPKPSLCGVLWDGPTARGEESQEKPPRRGIGVSSFYRAIADKKLVLRVSPDLDSERIGDVKMGTSVTVLEEQTLKNGDIRARIGKDTSPRGVGGFDLGWVTAVKDAESKLVPLVSLTASSASASWSHVRSDGGDASAGTSLASRIAAKRRSRRQTAGAASRAEVPEAAVQDEVGKAKEEHKPKREKKEVFELKTSNELHEIVADLIVEAEKYDSVQFDTCSSKLGQLLRDGNVKLDKLMGEWDRNKDGEISKQEFRLNVRLLGLSEAVATTKQIDSLYDKLDSDHSGSLDLKEIKLALRKLQEETSLVDQQEAQQKARAGGKRVVAEAFRQAVGATVAYEEGFTELEEMRANQDVGAKLGEVIKRRNIKVSELVAQWDEDGSGYIDRLEFRKHVRKVGLDATDPELDTIFNVLDDSGDEMLDPKELPNAFRKLLSASQQHKNDVADMTKKVKRFFNDAERAQKDAKETAKETEAKLVAEEAVTIKAAAEKAEKEAKAKAEVKAVKEAERQRALERQKTSMNFMSQQ